jgi:predicted DNA-binding transcriptional regulator AlpA
MSKYQPAVAAILQPATPVSRYQARSFGQAPNEAHISVREVSALVGCSVPSIWRMARDGRLPKPVHFGPRMTRWNVGELRAALAAKAAA